MQSNAVYRRQYDGVEELHEKFEVEISNFWKQTLVLRFIPRSKFLEASGSSQANTQAIQFILEGIIFLLGRGMNV